MTVRNTTLEDRARQILGVEAGADIMAIKKAYRRLARRYHPDCNRDADASSEKFMLITEAYNYLLRHQLPGRNSPLASGLNLEKEDPDAAYASWWMEHYRDFF
ncbi:J domain-containing protein [Moorella naiadis]|uniref:J domain-containing protein n=1 Tax=Moorella naiadis (nom. illeg.) TaxID=3093670 RepID=UPI003D9C8386